MDGNGVIRIGDTRVTLDTIISLYRRGDTAEELAAAFDTVGLADIHGVISYYLKNREFVDQYLAEKQRDAESNLDQIESEQRPGLSRGDLLDRMGKRQTPG